MDPKTRLLDVYAHGNPPFIHGVHSFAGVTLNLVSESIYPESRAQNPALR
jgi:hypothetical protein